MKGRALCTVLLIGFLEAAGLAAPGSFEEGMKAVAAGRYAAALPHLEAAVLSDPESLRYASEYRMAVIQAGEHDRAIELFEKLVAGHPKSANAWLNLGYAYVDKIPAAGSVTRVILANNALTHFSKSIELQRSWLALYTRGHSYLYWPRVFGRAPLGVADLEEAVAISETEPRKSVHVRAYVALGDGYWKTDQPEKARAAWREGLKLFPGDAQLQARLERDGEALANYIDGQLDPDKRVDTNLAPLFSEDRK